MRKSTYKFVAGLFAIALLAAGCSSSSDSASEETAATEESAAPAAADPELEIFTWWAAGGEAAGLAGSELEILAQQTAQLVLGGDDGDPAAGALEAREQRLDAQELRVVHHHFLAGIRVEEVVARDAVNRGRPTGDDGEIVGIGEARHDAVGQEVRPLLQHPGEPRRTACLHRLLDVAGLGPVDADHHRGPLGEPVDTAVDRNLAAHLVDAVRWHVTTPLPGQDRRC